LTSSMNRLGVRSQYSSRVRCSDLDHIERICSTGEFEENNGVLVEGPLSDS